MFLSATVINWNTWQSSTAGTMATYSPGGALVTNYPTYMPSGTFADGAFVSNAPTGANGILRITGGDPIVNTVLFSTPD